MVFVIKKLAVLKLMLEHIIMHLFFKDVERDSSVVECRTRNRESPGLNSLFATALKFGHFRSLLDASVHSVVIVSRSPTDEKHSPQYSQSKIQQMEFIVKFKFSEIDTRMLY